MELKQWIEDTIKLMEKQGDTDGLVWGDWPESYSYNEETGKYVKDGVDDYSHEDVTIENVYQHGGEGEGDNINAVFKLTYQDQVLYVDFYGHYASHYGADYSGWGFVEPKQKEITVYE